MEEPIAVIKPSIVNGIIPYYFKNIFYLGIFSLIAFFISLLLKSYNVIAYSTITIVLTLIGFTLVFALIPLIFKMFILNFTSYTFYRNYVVSEFNFVKITKMSVPYNQIVNISLDISIWDRICNAGDITLYSAEDAAPNVVLYYIKEPEKIESYIYNLIHKKGGYASQNPSNTQHRHARSSSTHQGQSRQNNTHHGHPRSSSTHHRQARSVAGKNQRRTHPHHSK